MHVTSTPQIPGMRGAPEGGSTPVRQLMAVVLPAPLGPSRQNSWPRGMVNQGPWGWQGTVSTEVRDISRACTELHAISCTTADALHSAQRAMGDGEEPIVCLSRGRRCCFDTCANPLQCARLTNNCDDAPPRPHRTLRAQNSGPPSLRQRPRQA